MRKKQMITFFLTVVFFLSFNGIIEASMFAENRSTREDLLLSEDFSGDWPPAGWEITSTSGQINWQQGDYGAQFYSDPPNVSVQRLITPELNTSDHAVIFVLLTHLVDDNTGDYDIRLETTSDGEEWTAAVAFPSVSFGPQTDEIMILTDDVGSETFQMAWTFDGDSANINWWTITNVEVIGIEPGFIEGTVTLDGGQGDIADVEITAGNVTVNPDEDGNYMIAIAPGIYDVTAELEYYHPQTIEDVVVTEGEVTAGIDFELEWILILNPPQSITIDPETSEITISPPEPYPGVELLHYNLYVDGDFISEVEETYFELTDFLELVIGQEYTVGISAVYDWGESEILYAQFTYEGTSADEPIASVTKLHRNYPNPFNPDTNIAFSLKTDGFVTIEIFNIRGEKVRSLVSEEYSAGDHTIVWDGKNDNENTVTTGIYYCKMKMDAGVYMQKMLMLK